MSRYKKVTQIDECLKIGRFTRWKVIGLAAKHRYITVECDCGQVRDVRTDSLISGDSQSCGCLALENSKKHTVTHGNSNKPLFRLWYDMNRRCYDKNRKDYRLYGGRGITVCDRWNKYNPEGFDNFVEDMGHPLDDKNELDRINNNKGYCKENCQWATRRQQTNNIDKNVKLSLDGYTLTVSEWAHLLGVKSQTLRDRVAKLEQDVEKALKSKFKRKWLFYLVDGVRCSTKELKQMTGLKHNEYYTTLKKGDVEAIGQSLGKVVEHSPENFIGRSYDEVLNFLKTGEGINDAYSVDIYRKYKLEDKAL